MLRSCECRFRCCECSCTTPRTDFWRRHWQWQVKSCWQQSRLLNATHRRYNLKNSEDRFLDDQESTARTNPAGEAKSRHGLKRTGCAVFFSFDSANREILVSILRNLGISNMLRGLFRKIVLCVRCRECCRSAAKFRDFRDHNYVVITK